MASIHDRLRSLGLASSRATTRLLLSPDLVEAALGRLGERRLSPEEQRVIVKATATPQRVRWPEWWEAM